MPQAIGHFAVGVAVGTLILIKTDWLKNEKINDIFFVFLLGLFAMIPDAPGLWNDFTVDNKPWADIFVFHKTLDKYLGDDILTSSILIGIAIVVMLMYFKQIRKRGSR